MIESASAAENLSLHSAEQSGVGQNLNQHVRRSADNPSKNNNEEPIIFRTAPEEMHHGDDLEDDSPRIEEMEHESVGTDRMSERREKVQ